MSVQTDIAAATRRGVVAHQRRDPHGRVVARGHRRDLEGRRVRPGARREVHRHERQRQEVVEDRLRDHGVRAGPRVRVPRHRGRPEDRDWDYRIEPTDTGCRVTETWTDDRGGFAKFAGKFASGVAERDDHNRDNMEHTLARAEGRGRVRLARASRERAEQRGHRAARARCGPSARSARPRRRTRRARRRPRCRTPRAGAAGAPPRRRRRASRADVSCGSRDALGRDAARTRGPAARPGGCARPRGAASTPRRGPRRARRRARRAARRSSRSARCGGTCAPCPRSRR